MIIDSHEHIMFPVKMQLDKMDMAGVDKTVLFCTAPHPERASTLNELEMEMESLNKILAGSNSREDNITRMKNNILEVVKSVKEYPNRFLGFGSVPLGMELRETEEWIDMLVTANSLYGVGEFTPGSEQQMKQLDILFQALRNTKIYPVWIHTFHPVTMDGIKILMSLCEKYPDIPVIFGHLGGTNWMDVIRFAKGHNNVYLDLSAAFSSLATKIALTELPERCLYSSDAPYGEPYLYRQLIEFVASDKRTVEMALGENISRLLALDER